jgi:ABC-type dipeptide/oligopeptide/nickel transport system, ATPase component
MNYAIHKKTHKMKKKVLFMIKDLQIKSFSDIENQIILDKVNLKIRKGENFGLIGETGSGKSMIGASLIDMIPSGCGITSGSIINYTNSPKKGLSLRGTKIAMISQDPMHALNPLQSIEKQFSSILIKRFGFNKNKAIESIINWVEKVKINNASSILSRYPHQLSGGQMQRIMIAIALSIQPELIIADEITTGLDANIKMKI